MADAWGKPVHSNEIVLVTLENEVVGVLNFTIIQSIFNNLF